MFLFTIQLILLISIGLIGIIFNWLLILAIQRKTYHHQETHRLTSNPIPTVNVSLLQETNSSIKRPTLRPPLSPSSRSSISLFEKYILAYLVNDLFVCNFLIPLRVIELAQGLPCVFFCFLWKLFERLTAVNEILIGNLLLLTSLLFFYKKHLTITQVYLLHLLLAIPLIFIYLLPTLTYFDVEEFQRDQHPPSCKQIFTFLHRTTTQILDVFASLITYLILLLQVLSLRQMKRAIKNYRQTSLKNLNETATLTRNIQQEIDQVRREFEHAKLQRLSCCSFASQNTYYYSARRSMYSPSIHNVSNTTSIATDLTPTTQRAFQTFDYFTYLTIIENSQTLVKSMYCLIGIYFLFYLPYWLTQLLAVPYGEIVRDMHFICHIFKPLCYMLTNEKYRAHVWAIVQCQPFRILPMLLRRKSRVVTMNNTTD